MRVAGEATRFEDWNTSNTVICEQASPRTPLCSVSQRTERDQQCRPSVAGRFEFRRSCAIPLPARLIFSLPLGRITLRTPLASSIAF